MKRPSYTAIAACALAVALAAGCAPKAVKEPPAPATAAPPMAAMPYTEKLDADGLFAFGKSSLDSLSADGRAQLDALADKLTAGGPIDMVHVIGHSDRIGSAKANVALSLKRANSVRSYLVERGVPADKITAVGRGSVEPVADCPTERNKALIACLAPNRRVEIKVIPAG